jgi:hypothetical protein
MYSKMVMTDKHGRRAFRMMVWGSRAIGWILIALAIASSLQIGLVAHMGESLRLVTSVALGLLGVFWIIGLELFLKFFDKFLSRN